MVNVSKREALRELPSFPVGKYGWFKPENINHMKKIWGEKIERLTTNNILEIMESKSRYVFLIGKNATTPVFKRNNGEEDVRVNSITTGSIINIEGIYYILGDDTQKYELFCTYNHPVKQYKYGKDEDLVFVYLT